LDNAIVNYVKIVSGQRSNPVRSAIATSF
jgi:hypothetical protein